MPLPLKDYATRAHVIQANAECYARGETLTWELLLWFACQHSVTLPPSGARFHRAATLKDAKTSAQNRSKLFAVQKGRHMHTQKMLLVIAVALLSAVLLNGCSLITEAETGSIVFETDPEDAGVGVAKQAFQSADGRCYGYAVHLAGNATIGLPALGVDRNRNSVAMVTAAFNEPYAVGTRGRNVIESQKGIVGTVENNNNSSIDWTFWERPQTAFRSACSGGKQYETHVVAACSRRPTECLTAIDQAPLANLPAGFFTYAQVRWRVGCGNDTQVSDVVRLGFPTVTNNAPVPNSQQYMTVFGSSGVWSGYCRCNDNGIDWCWSQ